MPGEAKIDIDYETFPALIATPEGRDKLAEYNMQDARLTLRLWERFDKFLFV